MKKYHVTPHAIERATERFGIGRAYAAGWLNQLMEHATFIGNQAHEKGLRQIYYHFNKKARIVTYKNTIITVIYSENAVGYNAEYQGEIESKPIVPEAFAEDVRQLVQRKFKAKERDFKRKQRALEIELAELNLELAQLTLNKLKAKSPKARNSIADKIDEVTTKVERIKFEINQAESAFEAMTKEVDAICKDSN